MAYIKLIVMGSGYQTYIGIDVQAIQKPFFYYSLNESLEILACGHGRLGDVLAYLAGQSSALVAVNGPICLDRSDGLIVQGGLFDAEHSHPGENHRTGDIILSTRGFPSVPNLHEGKKLNVWVERSLELTAGIRQLGYEECHAGQPRTYFETQSDAAYWLATGSVPYDSRSLEGRLQRQLLLYEFGFAVKDPMSFLEEFTRFRLRTSQIPMSQIMPAHELRALISAATAWLADRRPEAVDHMGEVRKGEIILPRDFSRK